MTTDERVRIPLLEQLNGFRKEGYHDIIIHVADKQFPCHRHVVAAACPALKPMLLEKNWLSETPTLKDVDPVMFEIILEYIYGGELKITSSNGFPLLKLADYFGMDDAMKLCKTFLKKSYSPSQIIQIYEFAHHLKDVDFIDTLTNHIALMLAFLRVRKEFLSLSFERIESILKKKKLILDTKGDRYTLDSTKPGLTNLSHRNDIFHAIVNWINGDVIRRIDHFSVLSMYTDLPPLYVDGLEKIFDNFGIVMRKHVEEDVSTSNVELVVHTAEDDEIKLSLNNEA